MNALPEELQAIREDLLDMAYINSLPHPLFANKSRADAAKNEWWWPIYDIEVQTGLVRIDVMGMLDVLRIGEIALFRDADGIEHEPDDFYVGADRTALGSQP